MTHIVIHEDSSNVTQYIEFDELQAAAAYLEELVTEEPDADARLFELKPVEFAVKSYVKIEIGAVEEAPAPAAAPAPAVAEIPPPPPAPEPELAQMDEVEVFTDESADDTVEYVEAAMAPADAYSPPATDDDGTGGEVRRGLFGR